MNHITFPSFSTGPTLSLTGLTLIGALEVHAFITNGLLESKEKINAWLLILYTDWRNVFQAANTCTTSSKLIDFNFKFLH